MDERFMSAHTELTLNKIDMSGIKCTGIGTCQGGHHPSPPLHDYPLLAWNHIGHPKHGKSVFTEDQKASVDEIAIVFPTMPDFGALATKYGTTTEHVRQAIAYAIRSGNLKLK